MSPARVQLRGSTQRSGARRTFAAACSPRPPGSAYRRPTRAVLARLGLARTAPAQGLWAGLLKLLIAGKKFLIVIVIGGIAGVKGILGVRKRKKS